MAATTEGTRWEMGHMLSAIMISWGKPPIDSRISNQLIKEASLDVTVLSCTKCKLLADLAKLAGGNCSKLMEEYERKV